MLLDNDKKYLVGVSGGPDSIFLINKLILEFNKNNFIVAVVNYNYRYDSTVDENIVRDFCKLNNLRYEILQTKWNNIGNFEAWAREKRYKWFSDLTKKNNLEGTIIAHNMNDNVETFLLQLERKSIPDHFGLKEHQKIFDTKIFRPILNYKKSEIINFLNNKKILYALDYTNEDIKYKRNNIRKNVLEEDFEKYLKQINEKNNELEKNKTKANNFIKQKNIKNEILIENDFKKLTIVELKLLLFNFFKINNKFNLIKNRKHSVISEIINRILNGKKKYWEISIDSTFLIYDFGKLKFSNHSLFDNRFTFNDIENIKIQKLKNIFVKYITQLSNYEITNDYFKYKKYAKIANKNLNKIFKDNKINYEIRSKLIILIDKNTDKIVKIIDIDTFNDIQIKQFYLK
ncbi:tRNA lysidine(34) synthetase TilS [Spiroplasma endosymbiont of Labia minor]|uniref:tRNA lysidine(34) synthetase TilS n=1 Tax=Spiroplasma endosymbiont of Labia minor TaxID=3066305 RepID=UPI0030D4A6B6